jgi:catechol 2,3-dioxygenase-like lactoylglutathione lyase family enzyme
VSTQFDHVGLSVGDLDAAAGFHRRAFGFEPEFAFELPVGGIRGLMMRHPSGMRLELFERPGSAPGICASDPIEALATQGYGHFALGAPDIGAVFAAAVAAGAGAVREPGPSPEPGVRFAFVADLEGNLIELVERR